MNSISSIALSGLQAAQLRASSAGHNIANAMTPGFRRQVVAQQAVDSGGVATTIARSPVVGDALAEDLVTLKLSEHLFAANLKVLRTQDRMLGTLLDEVA
ncbi:MAG TPA: flagellar basal body rod protein [Burkholderiaceae bacterium]